MLTGSLDEAQRKVRQNTACLLFLNKGRSSCLQSHAACIHVLLAVTSATLRRCARRHKSHVIACHQPCWPHLSIVITNVQVFLCQVEAYFYDMRRQLFEYDQVLNTQRDKVYGQRRRALLSKDLSPQMTEFAERTVDDILEVRCNSKQ